jgi:hypothetical protein
MQYKIYVCKREISLFNQMNNVDDDDQFFPKGGGLVVKSFFVHLTNLGNETIVMNIQIQ